MIEWLIMAFNTPFIPIEAIFCGISFLLGFVTCSYKVKKSIEIKEKLSSARGKIFSKYHKIHTF